MTLTGKPLAEFLAAVQQPDPTPGGGSVSALAGALGASLLVMVASMPRHRARTEEDMERLRAAGDRCREISSRLEALLDEDSRSYDRVIAAYRLPKDSQEAKAARSASIQAALRGAIETPLAVMARAVEALDAASIVAAFGSANAASDVGVALELLGAGVRGASINVDINLETVTDAGYATRIRQQAQDLVRVCESGVSAAREQLTGR